MIFFDRFEVFSITNQLGNTLDALELDLNQFGGPDLFFPYEVRFADEIREADHMRPVYFEIL